MENLSFKTEKGNLTLLFDDKAQKMAKAMKIEDKDRSTTSTTQFRKFYEKVDELNEKASSLKEEEFKIKILPFLMLLKSKVQYSRTRKNCNDAFVSLMSKSIEKVTSKEELQNFKYFLEAIIGYMPKN